VKPIMHFGALLAALLISSVSTADIIFLKNGDRLTGEIRDAGDDLVTISTEYAGEVGVRRDQITSMEKNGDVAVAAENEPAAAPEPDAPEVAQESIRDLDWSGNVGLNSSFSRGNTDSQLLNLQANVEAKSGQHRYVADISTIREELEGDKVKEQDRLNLGYNYLFQGKWDSWFFAVNATIEQDPVARIDRRISIGPSLGYDFWDDAHRQLNFQLGAGYADEETDNSDESSTVIDWRLNFSHDLSRINMELFHNHQVYRSMQGRKNVVLNSKTGMRYDITDDVYMNVQVNYDYDTEPAAGTDNEDVIFLIGVGAKL
jgi:putative salt-induced outer membrane protein YdiY